MHLFGTGLLADAEFLLGDDCAVTVDILANQVVKEAATLAYESLKCAGSGVILVVVFQMLSEVLDAHGEESDLAFRATGIVSASAVSLENLFLFFR